MTRSSTRFYCDEDVDGRFAEALRQRGFDVETAVGANRLNASDESQLAYAAAQQRVFVTHNVRHFPMLHRQWAVAGRDHSGIILLVGQAAIGPWLRRMDDLAQRLSMDQLKNQLLFVTASRN